MIFLQHLVFIFGRLFDEFIDTCNVTLYNTMIKTFRHKGLKAYFENGTKSGIQANHAPKLGRMLARLDEAGCAADMNLPGWGLHTLKGELKGHFSVVVNGNWRIIFKFEDGDVILVDYKDYH